MLASTEFTLILLMRLNILRSRSVSTVLLFGYFAAAVVLFIINHIKF